jgi:hypothetical protein
MKPQRRHVALDPNSPRAHPRRGSAERLRGPEARVEDRFVEGHAHEIQPPFPS